MYRTSSDISVLLQQVRSATDENCSQDPRVRKLMAKITSYDNVPRKEAKFKVN